MLFQCFHCMAGFDEYTRNMSAMSARHLFGLSCPYINLNKDWYSFLLAAFLTGVENRLWDDHIED